jgi:hypothetical protein
VVGLPVLLFVTGVVSSSDVLEQQPQQQDVVSSVGAQSRQKMLFKVLQRHASAPAAAEWIVVASCLNPWCTKHGCI